MRFVVAIFGVSFLLIGCEETQIIDPKAKAPANSKSADPQAKAPGTTTSSARTETEDEPKPEKTPEIPDSYKALNKEKTCFLETTKEGQRRVHLLCMVVARDVPLEFFLCKFQTKEHESIVNCDVDARTVHEALLVAKAIPGSTVKFSPYKAATGTKIKVSMTYYLDGKQRTDPAQHWIRDKKSGKELAYDWVFAGSQVIKDPFNEKETLYLANGGAIISLSNFPDSMMDLPIESTDKNEELMFEAWTDRIPPKRTMVLLTLEPVLEKK